MQRYFCSMLSHSGMLLVPVNADKKHDPGEVQDIGHVHAGHLDADLQLQHSLTQPEVGGAMRFSRGVAYLNPQGPSPTGQGSAEAGAQEADLVAQAFSALHARKEGTANGLVRHHSRLEGSQQVLQTCVNLILSL